MQTQGAAGRHHRPKFSPRRPPHPPPPLFLPYMPQDPTRGSPSPFGVFEGILQPPAASRRRDFAPDRMANVASVRWSYVSSVAGWGLACLALALLSLGELRPGRWAFRAGGTILEIGIDGWRTTLCVFQSGQFDPVLHG